MPGWSEDRKRDGGRWARDVVVRGEERGGGREGGLRKKLLGDSEAV